MKANQEEALKKIEQENISNSKIIGTEEAKLNLLQNLPKIPLSTDVKIAIGKDKEDLLSKQESN